MDAAAVEKGCNLVQVISDMGKLSCKISQFCNVGNDVVMNVKFLGYGLFPYINGNGIASLFSRTRNQCIQIVKLAAIHHVAIIVSDYEKSKDFYVNKLGFAVVRENFRKERNDWKLDLCVGDGADAIELEIFAELNPPKRVNRPEACGLRHLAFRVDDVETTVAELAQMGIECEPIRLDSYTQKKMTFFFDPDGLPLELHE